MCSEVAKISHLMFFILDRKYIEHIVKESFGQINQDDAQDFIRILYHNKNYGRTEALKHFDILVDKLIDKYENFDAHMKISFMLGMLYPSGIVTKEESDSIRKKYTDKVAEKMGLKQS